MSLRYSLLILSLVTLFACEKSNDNIQQYIYIGHSYNWKAMDGNQIDPRVEALKPNHYDQIWLGGDICGRTAEKKQTLEYLDKLLNISKPTTLWALGNHDINKGNPEFISPMTKRPFSYSQSANGITHIVLNTNLGHHQVPEIDSTALCQALDNQFSIIKNVTDTIESSAYLILLHHHGLLTKTLADNRAELLDKWHVLRPDLPFHCSPNSTFEEAIYPLLIKVQEKGVQVILVGGDIGQRSKKFEFQTKEGIWFLGSGINNSMNPKYKPKYVTNLNPDSLLVFDYNLESRKLDWHFFEL